MQFKTKTFPSRISLSQFSKEMQDALSSVDLPPEPPDHASPEQRKQMLNRRHQAVMAQLHRVYAKNAASEKARVALTTSYLMRDKLAATNKQ